MLGLPVDFDIQFIPLDGGPSLPSNSGETIFQNPTLGTLNPVPEPSYLAALGIGGGALLLIHYRRQRRRGSQSV